MEMNFCRRCGAALEYIDESAYRCTNQHMLFVNSAPCVGVFFVTDDKQVLLSVRGIEPYKGMLDTLGGFVEIDETFEEAAVRELQEEAGITPDQYEALQFISTETGIYPYDGEDRAILGVFFWSRLKQGVTLQPADDVSEIVQIPLAEVDLTQLDNGDVYKAIKKLQDIML